jgi:hypothetical protein
VAVASESPYTLKFNKAKLGTVSPLLDVSHVRRMPV